MRWRCVRLQPWSQSRTLPHLALVGSPDGLLVRGVEDGSPAAQAGIEAGDLLVAAAGTALGTADDLFAALEASEATLTLMVVRGTDERAVEVQFDAPAPAEG